MAGSSPYLMEYLDTRLKANCFFLFASGSTLMMNIASELSDNDKLSDEITSTCKDAAEIWKTFSEEHTPNSFIQVQNEMLHCRNIEAFQHYLSSMFMEIYLQRPEVLKSKEKISIEEVISAVNIIKGLEPRPGRQFSDEEPHYIIPDIFVYKMEDDFVIVLNDDGMPKLHINAFYQKAIHEAGKVSDQTKEYIQDKLRSAVWLIRSIHQRQKTILKVMESILRFQREFFEHGIAHLKPMVLRDVAQDIGMHESTISRVTTNKYVYTPQGTFELKYFFNSSINRVYGGAIASASVQEKIKQIIESENSKKPYSDSQIAKILNETNIDIARRTVAKYREMLGVLPSNKRKQF